MTTNPTHTLAQRAAHLEKIAGTEWKLFMQDLAVYVEMHRKNLINSPLPTLQVSQGKAQAMVDLLELLSKARETAEKIERAKK